ncbi:MAG: hypothetical protein ACJ76A_07655 [Actinomycetota bacterium]|jgi:hypothetical protein
MRQGAQHVVPRRRIPVIVLIVAMACGSASTPPAASPGASVGAPIPDLGLAHMHVADITKTGEQATLDATDQQAMLAQVDDSGLVGVRERVYTGGRGAYSRVVVRAWQFDAAGGAAQFLSWLETNGRHSVIGEAKPTQGPTSVFFVHEPSGCCHEETPIYLAAWQASDVVWTVVASGPRIQTPPVLQLVQHIQQEV